MSDEFELDLQSIPVTLQVEDAIKAKIASMLKAGRSFRFLPGCEGRFTVLGRRVSMQDVICLKMGVPDRFFLFDGSTLEERVILGLGPLEIYELCSALLMADEH